MEQEAKQEVTKKKKKSKNKIASILNLLGELLLIGVILVCIPLTVPRIFGYEVYSVVSGSMEPAIPTGSLVYIKSIEPEKVEEDSVIAFYSPSNPDAIITHRVITNKIISGEFTTKGDANEAEDPSPVPYDNLVGKVTLSVPYVGELLSGIASTEGKIIIIGIVVEALALQVIAAIIQKKKK